MLNPSAAERQAEEIEAITLDVLGVDVFVVRQWFLELPPDYQAHVLRSIVLYREVTATGSCPAHAPDASEAVRAAPLRSSLLRLVPVTVG